MVATEPELCSKPDSEADFQGIRNVGGTRAILSTRFPS